MPRLFSPSLPATPMLGRTLTIPIPVPFSRSRSARIQPRLILLIVSICAVLGLVLHPASPAKTVLPANLVLGGKEDLDLITEKHDGAWGWFREGTGKETVLVTGGAGQLGQALIPTLLKQYNVHIFDITPRPASLPISPSLTYHRGSIDPTSPALSKLFAKTRIDGIIHLAAISLEEWCAPRLAECEKINVGGTKSLLDQVVKTTQKRLVKGARPKPWMVMASSMEVYGTLGQMERNPITIIGKTKLAAELLIEQAMEVDPELRAGIIRFDQIYGYHHAAAIDSTFIPSLIGNALTSIPIQYSSGKPASDYLYIDDAVAGLVSAIEAVRQADTGSEAHSYDIVSGEMKTQEEVLEIVKRHTSTLSPIRDIQPGPHTPSSPYNPSSRLEWKASFSTDLETGLARTIADLVIETERYGLQYLTDNCPSSQPMGSTPSTFGHKLHPADARNRDLTKLDGCTVNIGFNHDGMLHHLKCEDGKHCIVDGAKVPSYNWNQTVFVVHKVKEQGKKMDRRVKVQFKEEKGMGWLGFARTGREVGLELFGKDQLGVQTSFDLEVQSDVSNLRLMVPGGEQIHAVANATGETNWFALQSTPAAYDMRMTVLCCPSQGDWPLLLDDHESADIRFGTTGQIPFNSSRRLHLCDRASQAVKYNSARLAQHQQDTPTTKHIAQKTLSAKPNTWALRDLPPCWNDCDSPTICVQTGSCRCVQADHCPPRRQNPLLMPKPRTSSSGITAKLGSHLGSLAGYSPVLVEAVAKTDWRDVLLPQAREAITANPEFIKLHVADGYAGQSKIEAAECHNLQSKHCFSADSILYKAMRHISVPADQADMVVLPVYQHCTGADFMLHDVMAHARLTIPGVASGEKPVSVVMTHDWGICIAFAWEIWSARDKHSLYPDSILDNTLVFSVMGDYDSPCYRPAQDVVIPARTCQSISLKDHFSAIESVRPMRERRNLMTWSGTYWGTGKTERLRLTCERGGAGAKELVKGGGRQSNFESWDYMNDLSNARFCPQPRGIAGWSPRTNDAIYAGCIPVLIAEGSHYPFASFLDWSKFSVRIGPTELDNIEAILSAIPLEKVEEMQANLVAVREAFVYATDEKPEEELERRGPMFFALHEAGLRLKTKYPGK